MQEKRNQEFKSQTRINCPIEKFLRLPKEKYENTFMDCFLQTFKARMIAHYIVICGRGSFDHHIFRNLI